MRNFSEQNAVDKTIVDELFDALLHGGCFTETLQMLADYSYVLEENVYQAMVDLVHTKLFFIVQNVLNFEENEGVLSALWLLENQFGVSYEELLMAVEDDVKSSTLFQSGPYPALWLEPYYLVKAGYDYFYERQDMLLNFYPDAMEEIVATFYME